jgi:hypothetical protein
VGRVGAAVVGREDVCADQRLHDAREHDLQCTVGVELDVFVRHAAGAVQEIEESRRCVLPAILEVTPSLSNRTAAAALALSATAAAFPAVRPGQADAKMFADAGHLRTHVDGAGGHDWHGVSRELPAPQRGAFALLHGHEKGACTGVDVETLAVRQPSHLVVEAVDLGGRAGREKQGQEGGTEDATGGMGQEGDGHE